MLAIQAPPVPARCGPPLHRDFPRVFDQLARRGIALEPVGSETDDHRAERLATALMALFRDTRSPRVYEALYALAGPSVLDWIRRMARTMRCSSDPAELLQDTFVNVYRYSARFRAERDLSFRGWVRTIGANVVKRAARVSRATSLSALPEGLQEPTDECSGPARRAMAAEELTALRGSWALFLAHYLAAFQALSPRDRRALELVEVEGCSYAEVGRILGVGGSNTKMIMFRARRRLCAQLARLLEPRAERQAA